MSNKTPKASVAKTGSAPKKSLRSKASSLLFPFGLIIAAILLLIIVASHDWPQTLPLRIGNNHFTLEVADKPSVQAKGLGERKSMASNWGMLFVFPNQNIQCFWMKDMHFPLDIIWLNSDKQVVHLGLNISPDTYPRTFCPATPARYVIELNGGSAKSSGIILGRKLQF